jgi:hypothetical protein
MTVREWLSIAERRLADARGSVRRSVLLGAGCGNPDRWPLPMVAALALFSARGSVSKGAEGPPADAPGSVTFRPTGADRNLLQNHDRQGVVVDSGERQLADGRGSESNAAQEAGA